MLLGLDYQSAQMLRSHLPNLVLGSTGVLVPEMRLKLLKPGVDVSIG